MKRAEVVQAKQQKTVEVTETVAVKAEAKEATQTELRKVSGTISQGRALLFLSEMTTLLAHGITTLLAGAALA